MFNSYISSSSPNPDKSSSSKFVYSSSKDELIKLSKASIGFASSPNSSSDEIGSSAGNSSPLGSSPPKLSSPPSSAPCSSSLSNFSAMSSISSSSNLSKSTAEIIILRMYLISSLSILSLISLSS